MITTNPRIDTRSPRSTLLFISAVVALLLVAAGPQLSAAENDTACDPETPWGYDGFKGPLYWGTECTPKEVAHATPTPSQMQSALTNATPTPTATPTPIEPDQSYAVCLDGNTQSPVSATSLNSQETLAQVPISPTNGTATGKVNNNGHAIAVGSLKKDEQPLTSNSTIEFNGTTYKLKQLHFHCPSEHRRSTTVPFDQMEMHLVHESESDPGSLAVVAVFFNVGPVNNELQNVVSGIPAGSGITLQVSGLLPPASNRSAWIYYGSLTTPACDEGVKWFVMKQPITATVDQINAFKDAYSNNSRGASFEKIPGGLSPISSGEAGVWGVNNNYKLYVRMGINANNIRGTDWQQMKAGPVSDFVDVSSGKYGVWLVSKAHEVWHIGTDGKVDQVTAAPANTIHVSAGKYGVWVLDDSRQVFYRTGVTESAPIGTKWTKFDTAYKIKNITSGEFGVWGVDTSDVLYFLRDSMAGSLASPTGSIFSKVDSNISRVSSGFLGVWALGTGGTSQVIKSRSGITTENPTGSGWRVQDGLLNEIASGKYGVWGTAKSTNTSDPTPIYFFSSPPTK
jgi:carbonic anhydrase